MNQMFSSWFFYFQCLDWTTSSPCRKMCKDCSCSVIRLKKGWFGEIGSNRTASHPAVTVASCFATSNGEKRSKEENAPKTSQHVGVEGICERVSGFIEKCFKTEQETSHRGYLCLQPTLSPHPPPQGHKLLLLPRSERKPWSLLCGFIASVMVILRNFLL